MNLADFLAARTGKSVSELFSPTTPLVRLEDRGEGPFVAAWDASLGEKPTPKEIAEALAAPEPVRVPASVSRRQFFQAAAMTGFVSEAEAEAAVAGQAIPAAILALIDTLPADQKFSARMEAIGAPAFERGNPLLNTLAERLGHTGADVDELFRLASTL